MSVQPRKVPKRLAQRSHRRLEVPRDGRLVRERSLSVDFYKVISGALVSSRSGPAGRRQVVGFYYSGDWILPGRPEANWEVSVHSLTGAGLEAYSLQDIRKACSDDPELGFDLFELACRELSRRLDNSERLRCLSVDERFAAFLLDSGQRLGHRAGPGLLLELPMTRNMIADHLGIRVETLSRIIRRLRDAGVIELDGARKIKIPILAKLEQVAAPRK